MLNDFQKFQCNDDKDTVHTEICDIVLSQSSSYIICHILVTVVDKFNLFEYRTVSNISMTVNITIRGICVYHSVTFCIFMCAFESYRS